MNEDEIKEFARQVKDKLSAKFFFSRYGYCYHVKEQDVRHAINQIRDEWVEKARHGESHVPVSSD